MFGNCTAINIVQWPIQRKESAEEQVIIGPRKPKKYPAIKVVLFYTRTDFSRHFIKSTDTCSDDSWVNETQFSENSEKLKTESIHILRNFNQCINFLSSGTSDNLFSPSLMSDFTWSVCH